MNNTLLHYKNILNISENLIEPNWNQWSIVQKYTYLPTRHVPTYVVLSIPKYNKSAVAFECLESQTRSHRFVGFSNSNNKIK